MIKKEKNKLYLGYITSGSAFLFIPSISIFDVMPDLIGFLLIIRGLSRMYDLNADIESARSSFIKLFFLELAKTAFIPLLVSFNDETTVMTTVFIFSIIEGIMLFFAIRSAFSGIHYIAERLDCKNADTGFGDLYVTSIVFVIARYVLVTIPELTVMTSLDYQMTDDLGTHTVYNYKGLITIACFLISLVVGIYFFTACVRYINGLNRDVEFKKRLYEMYERDVLSDFNLSLRRNTKYAVYFTIAAFLCICPVMFEGVDITPSPIAILLMAVGISYLKPYCKIASLTRKICIFSAAFSAALYAFSVYVSSEYYHWSYTIHEKAVKMYTLSGACQCVDCIIVIACACCVLITFFEHLKKYGTDKSLNTDSYQHKEQEKEKKRLKVSLLIRISASGLLCVLSCIMFFMYINNEIYWLVILALTLIWTVYCGIGLFRILTAVEDNNL